ncbi:uncharacterized protein LOC142776883 [Rhipicephalus microplus]|uniref:uncharacterized protein LOC142776883 n=1 Tax=Rhipicephalus microplus TaxID=6941 RepID=UPI003F6BE7BD
MVGSRERSKRQPRVFAPAHLLHSTVQSQRRLLCTPVKGCYWLRFTITDARLPFAQGERENIPSTKALQNTSMATKGVESCDYRKWSSFNLWISPDCQCLRLVQLLQLVS